MARRGSSMIKALRSSAAGMRRDAKLKKITEAYSDARKTRKQAWGGRGSSYWDNVDYNTYRKVILAQEKDMKENPNLRRANKCMQRALMKGANSKQAFESCGMSTGGKTNRGSRKSRQVFYDDSDRYTT